MESPTEIIKDIYTSKEKQLNNKEEQLLLDQNKRLISPFKSNQLELQAQKNWDLFYKRNETRFFRDRHWTTREFAELLECDEEKESLSRKCRQMLEVGCGVGNLIFPLIKDKLATDIFFYACDFSPRAVDFVRSHPLYNEEQVIAFQCDITTEFNYDQIEYNSLDIVTMVFVLSAIHPKKFVNVIQNIWKLLKPGGVILFRDYGRFDMAQLRFKAGHKIEENLYMRQDGTRSYFFSVCEISSLFKENGFEVIKNDYIHRRTVNFKESIDVPRIFLQGKFKKI